MSKLSENVSNVLFQLMVISSKQWIVLCSKIKRSVSEWVSEWQGHLLSCSGQLKMEYSVATGVSYIINFRSIFLNILQITMPLSEDWCGKCRTNLPPHKHRLDGSCCVLRADGTFCKFNLACWNGVGALCLHQTPDVWSWCSACALGFLTWGSNCVCYVVAAVGYSTRHCLLSKSLPHFRLIDRNRLGQSCQMIQQSDITLDFNKEGIILKRWMTFFFLSQNGDPHSPPLPRLWKFFIKTYFLNDAFPYTACCGLTM